MKDKCISILKDLTRKKFILFVRRGNTAIRLALKLAKKHGHTKVLIQDQGGWLTYKQFCKKEKLDCIELETNSGILLSKTINDYSDCVLLMNSMPAYAYVQNMKLFEKVCKEKKIFLVNDASGSIGTSHAEKGDIVFASFGPEKPIELGAGGFMATDNYEDYDFLEKNNPEFTLNYEKLLKKLNKLTKKLNYYKITRKKILDDLRDYDIIHRTKPGINVIVKFYNERERERLINYCNNEKLEYTICPRAIRVKDKAICIEIKRR